MDVIQQQRVNRNPNHNGTVNWDQASQTIEMACDTVVINKMFGPTIFADLRITADMTRGWVIERQWIATGQWVEWCVIPAQIDAEFLHDDD